MKYIILLFLVLSFSGFAAEPCPEERELLTEKRIDLDTKTIKGWIRLFKNREKLNQYGVYLSKTETLDLIKCLTDELNQRKLSGKMV